MVGHCKWNLTRLKQRDTNSTISAFMGIFVNRTGGTICCLGSLAPSDAKSIGVVCLVRLGAPEGDGPMPP